MELDYKKLGLKIGLEVHQQLDTGKLFCKCPCLLRDDKPDIVVRRKIRASAGETGEVDVAAAMEKEKDLTFIYEGYNDTTCCVEFDAEPPGEMNRSALEMVLQIAKLLDATVVDQIQVMRKTIANGSVTSGFQRTSLVAVNGKMSFSWGEVGVPVLLLEEDAAKDISRGVSVVTYRLDRLGIPLIELATTPDIHTPEQCKEVASYIGMIFRSTGKAKRGIGTIRQDLNINISGTSRVELKGAQDLKLLPQVVHYEVLRHKNLLELSKEIKSITYGKFVDMTELFQTVDSKVIKKGLSQGGKVYGIRVDGFKGVLGREVQPGRRVGSELSDWAKVFAGVGGIFHSDELPKYGITEMDVGNVRNMLGCGPADGFVLVVSTEDRCLHALEAVVQRLELIPKGVVKHVRKVNADGTSSFLRLMPGAARMYPETDVPPIVPSMKVEKPELVTTVISRLEEVGLGKDLATLVGKSGRGPQFEKFVASFKNVKPAFIAEVYLKGERTVKTMFGVDVAVSDEEFGVLFEYLDKGLVSKDAVYEILKEGVKNIDKFKLMSDSDLKKELGSVVAANKGLPFNALIGKAMAKLKGKADGKKIVEMLKGLCR